MILNRILEDKHDEVEALRKRRVELEARAGDAPPVRDFTAALRRSGEVAVIAEFKRRSPSAGVLAAAADPAEVARAYREAGAAALSVLTDGPHFGGSVEDLTAVRAAADLPVLRKDFVLDPLQVTEARAAGADAVLLIVRALDDGRLAELLAAVETLNMTALVEVHDREELARAVRADAGCVGVNARDLSTFRVDRERCAGLVADVPGGVIAVAESGLRTPADVERMGRAGADAVLVGSALMGTDPARTLAPLTGRPRRARAASRTPESGYG